ncbi:MAG: hypothetical protein ACKVU4_04540 [Phycisphaerales bacterium]
MGAVAVTLIAFGTLVAVCAVVVSAAIGRVTRARSAAMDTAERLLTAIGTRNSCIARLIDTARPRRPGDAEVVEAARVAAGRLDASLAAMIASDHDARKWIDLASADGGAARAARPLLAMIDSDGDGANSGGSIHQELEAADRHVAFAAETANHAATRLIAAARGPVASRVARVMGVRRESREMKLEPVRAAPGGGGSW